MIFFAFIGLQLMSTVRSQDCATALGDLAAESDCQSAFQSFDLNITAAESTLCTDTCEGLVNDVVSYCGDEFVSSLYKL